MKLTPINPKGIGLIVSQENILYYFSGDGYCSEDNLYYAHDGIKTKEVSYSEYLSIKFGNNYQKVLPLLEDTTESTRFLPSGELVTCGYRDFTFQWFDSDGNLIKRMPDIYEDSIYDFVFDDTGALWFVVPTRDKVCKYDFAKNEIEEIFKEQKLSFPESLSIYNETLFISNMGHRNILTYNIKTGAEAMYAQFQEPVWEYVRLGEKEFVALDSGLYSMEL